MATIAVKKRKPVFVNVEDLKPGTTGHNLIIKVVSSKVTRAHKTRHTSSSLSQRSKPPSHIAKCLVGDNIASIVFTTYNDQRLPFSFFLDMIKLGAIVITRNAKIDMFKGFTRLAFDKRGHIEVANLQTS
ncbi:hypothetical protein K2173_026538 [Erythroxylum novogranatense]|uniref:Single-stranded DNA binding protein Ssb-like OB fold domain-containing protein n=1 Tax=Erythroxylum novogranatense TaxID=1862640 RepID=A0AAV8TXU4_9ROSI|nr:hypothetical protein K2173_026538 [Erythroxylum novogranatense]